MAASFAGYGKLRQRRFPLFQAALKAAAMDATLQPECIDGSCTSLGVFSSLGSRLIKQHCVSRNLTIGLLLMLWMYRFMYCVSSMHSAQTHSQ